MLNIIYFNNIEFANNITLSYISNIIIESCAVFVFVERNIKNICIFLLYNAFTILYLWLVALIMCAELWCIIMHEIVIAMTESFVIFRFYKINFKLAVRISIIANALSFVLPLVIRSMLHALTP